MPEVWYYLFKVKKNSYVYNENMYICSKKTWMRMINTKYRVVANFEREEKNGWEF